MTEAVFHAVADPTRRHIIEALSQSGSATATALAADLDISRQAVAKHLVLLADAGLASSERVGRETRYHPQLDGLDPIAQWVTSVEGAWQKRLGALAEAVSPDGRRKPAPRPK